MRTEAKIILNHTEASSFLFKMLVKLNAIIICKKMPLKKL